MRGRKPKPLERQIAEGDTRKRGVRKLQEAMERMPQAQKGLPRCPSHLKGRARKVWNFLAEQLELSNLAYRPDAPMLEGLCINYALAVEADLRIAKEGTILTEPIYVRGVRTEGVRLRKHPCLAISNSAWGLFRSMAGDFGLSPVSRTRLTVDPINDGESELHAILSKPRTTKMVI